MADLKTSVQFIHGIGPQRAKALEKLGIAHSGRSHQLVPPPL